LKNLRREIDLYNQTLSSRPWIVVANKMDLPGAKENLKAMQESFPRIKIVPTSSLKGEGVDALKEALAAIMTNDKDVVAPPI
jgi:GTPase